jgi:hypothetical protein
MRRSGDDRSIPATGQPYSGCGCARSGIREVADFQVAVGLAVMIFDLSCSAP